MNGRERMIAIAKINREDTPFLVDRVMTGELTSEEAAKCLAGAIIKVLDAAGNCVDHDREYRQALVAIETRLPGFDGLVIGRHF